MCGRVLLDLIHHSCNPLTTIVLIIFLIIMRSVMTMDVEDCYLIQLTQFYYQLVAQFGDKKLFNLGNYMEHLMEIKLYLNLILIKGYCCMVNPKLKYYRVYQKMH